MLRKVDDTTYEFYYTIVFEGGKFICDCPAFQFSKNGRCKHVSDLLKTFALSRDKFKAMEEREKEFNEDKIPF